MVMVQSEISHSQVIDIESQYDVVVARQSGRALARIMGFGTAQQTRLNKHDPNASSLTGLGQTA